MEVKKPAGWDVRPLLKQIKAIIYLQLIRKQQLNLLFIRGNKNIDTWVWTDVNCAFWLLTVLLDLDELQELTDA